MKVSLVVPVFNEEEAVPVFVNAVRTDPGLSSFELEVVFVNDGSVDRTESAVRGIQSRDAQIVLINFSRNFGKEAALLAGIEHSTGDVVIPMDVDLQDPLAVIPEMLRAHESGADVVLARRVDRRSDGFLKRTTASLFYKVINRLSDTPIYENVGDFRLLSRRAVNAVRQMPETKLFMKGMLSWIGFRTAVVDYVRPSRSVGQTKFSGWRLWNFALEGITSFSTAPLRIWTYMGVSVALLAFVYGLWMIADKVFFGNPVPGYPSLMVSILFFGGVQLIGIGVLGEYIGRIYIEAKRRPRYLVKDIVSRGVSVGIDSGDACPVSVGHGCRK